MKQLIAFTCGHCQNVFTCEAVTTEGRNRVHRHLSNRCTKQGKATERTMKMWWAKRTLMERETPR